MDQRNPDANAPSQAPLNARSSTRPGLFWVQVFVVVAGLGLLIWLTSSVLLLIFAAIVLATALDTLARLAAGITRLPHRAALTLVLLVLAALTGLGGYLLAPPLIDQIDQLWRALSGVAENLQVWLGDRAWGRQILGEEEQGQIVQILGYAAGAARAVTSSLAYLLLLVITSVFLAAQPQLYRDGLLMLVPIHRRGRGAQVLSDIAHALRHWLLGQLISMLVLGTLTSLGLLALGVEVWLGLGILTGILTFIPFLGPVIAGVPIVAIGFTQGLEFGLAVLAFYLLLQNLEGNVLTPLIQQRAVSLPPALLLSMQLTFGALFGFAGIIMAAPLTVVGMVAVHRLYVEDTLGDTETSVGI